MTLIYDENVFQAFRKKAVTSIEQLVVGRRYYTNHYPEQFVLKEIVTWAEMDRREGCDHNSDDVTLQWMEYESEYGTIYGGNSYLSVRDQNITDSYNPWLVFENEQDAIDCRTELHINYGKSHLDDDYPLDWYDDNYDYEEVDYHEQRVREEYEEMKR